MPEAAGEDSLEAERGARIRSVLREGRDEGEDLSVGAVMRLAAGLAECLRATFETHDAALRAELGAVAREIAGLRADLAGVGVAEMTSRRIPAAGRELDAVVEATEAATGAIMSAAEAIMAADPDDGYAYRETVNASIMAIFEACAFQDITGQRLTKIDEALQNIGSRLGLLVDRLRLGDAEAVTETDRERRARELLLGGPQRRSEAASQDDVDALFG